MAEEDQEQEEIAPPPAKGPYRYLLLIIIIMLLETAGAFVFLDWAVPAPEVVEEEAPIEVLAVEKFVPPIFYEQLAEMTFSPLDSQGRHLVLTTVVLEVDRQPGIDEITLKHTPIWDLCVQTLEGYSIAQLRDPERGPVKEHLIEAINGELRNGIVTGLYFTDFIMQ